MLTFQFLTTCPRWVFWYFYTPGWKGKYFLTYSWQRSELAATRFKINISSLCLESRLSIAFKWDWNPARADSVLLCRILVEKVVIDWMIIWRIQQLKLFLKFRKKLNSCLTLSESCFLESSFLNFFFFYWTSSRMCWKWVNESDKPAWDLHPTRCHWNHTVLETGCKAPTTT